MSTYAERATFRPVAEKTDYRRPSVYRTWAPLIALSGLMVVAVATIANFAVGDDPAGERADTLAWTFGLNFTGIAIVMLGIITTLVGILIRLWLRVESVKEALPLLKAEAGPGEPDARREIDTPQGRAEVTASPPKPLWIHYMAEWGWVPMLLMGPMLVVVGFILALVQAGEDDAEKFFDLAAWSQGLTFLGLAMILGAISFILGTILSSLRKGGAEVQQSLGVQIQTLKVPWSAWGFVGLMMMGVMLAMLQFVLYLLAAGSDTPQEWFAWLGPLAQFSLGILLSGITLALFTIGTVLAFQFNRLQQIITTGR